MNNSILVVDDDPQIRRVMRTALTSKGYAVSDARNGEEALEKVRSERFDLILLDMNMPGMDGLETCRWIRSGSEVGIIMVTVRGGETDKVAALDAGADDYVTKPFSMPELLARIRANLRRVPTALSADQPGLVRFGEVEVNLSTRHVRVRGKECRLTPKEFDLLQYFLGNPNTTVPHRKLLQAIWGPDYGDQVEYLHVFVNQLRKKIEINPAKPVYLITEPWVGYRFQLAEPE